jgi:transposase
VARKRLTVKKVREVIRLKYKAGLSNRAIAGACKISNSTVGEYLKRIEAAGICWPLGDMGEKELLEKMFPEKQTSKPTQIISMPDWEKVKTERRRKGVTLQLLWDDYKHEHPDGYEYSQYCEHYRRWKKSKEEPSMHKDHKGGENMEVDYAGMKISMTDPESGEIVKLSVFVATFPASNYIYAEAQTCENQCNWNNGHVRAFDYFGGVPKIIIPDNLRTGITKPNYYEPGVNHSYQELAEHYHFAVLPARVKRPKDKAAIENGVQNVERWIIAPLRDRKLFGLGEANNAINEQLEYLNNRIMKGVGLTRRHDRGFGFFSR